MTVRNNKIEITTMMIQMIQHAVEIVTEQQNNYDELSTRSMELLDQGVVHR